MLLVFTAVGQNFKASVCKHGETGITRRYGVLGDLFLFKDSAEVGKHVYENAVIRQLKT